MNNPEPSPRQARRIARRKTEILEAAATVFAQKGFHRATTKDIAEEADISEGTIYNYFESKDDLLINLIDWLADLSYRRKLYAQSLDIDFRQFFHDMMLERITVVKERNTLFLAILPEIVITPHLRELYVQRVMRPALHDLEDLFRARVERGHIGSVDVPMTVRMMTALALGLEFLTILGDTETQAVWDDTDRLADLLTHAIFDGMLSSPTPTSESDNPSPHVE